MSNIIPAGVYMGRATICKSQESLKKGTKGYEATFEIVETGAYKGRKVVWNGWLVDAKCGEGTVAERTIDSLLFMGCTFPGDDTTNLDGFAANEVALVISIEEYTPEPTEANPAPRTTERNVVEWVNRGLGGRAGVEVTTDQGKAAFRAEAKGALAAARARQKAGGAAAPASTEGLPKDAAGKPRF